MTVYDPNRTRIAETAAALGGALRVGRNISFRLTSQAVSGLINVAGMVLLANALAAAGYGEYAFYYALIPLIASMSDAGIGIVITREIARDRTSGPRLFGDAILIKGAVSGLILLAALAISWSTLDPARAALVTLVTATALIDPGQDSSIWVLRAHERQGSEALLLILSQVVWLMAVAVGAVLEPGLLLLLGAATLAFALRLAVAAAIVSRRLYRPRFELDPARLRRHLVQGLPFGAAMLGVVLYGRSGLLMLKGLAAPSDVAYFHVAYMLSQPLGFIASGLSIAVFPVLSRQARRGDDSLRRSLRRTFKCQVLLALPMSVGLFLLAGPIISMLFHRHGFQQAAVGLQAMSLGLVVIFLNLSSRYLLAALDRQQHYLRAIVAGLVTNVVLGAVLIPRLGFLGACGAFLGAEATIWLVCQQALSRHVRLGELAAEAVKPLLAATGMGLLVFALRGANVVLLALIGTVAYAAFLWLLRAFSDQETRILRAVCGSFGLPGSDLRQAENRS